MVASSGNLLVSDDAALSWVLASGIRDKGSWLASRCGWSRFEDIRLTGKPIRSQGARSER